MIDCAPAHVCESVLMDDVSVLRVSGVSFPTLIKVHVGLV